MKNVRLMTILEAVGAFLLAFMCFGNTDNMKKCIVWGIVLIAWTAFFEVSRRAQKKKEGK